jgi:acetamidase/formamidase
MATYHIEPTREHLHGSFSRDLPPVLTIESGDTVTYRTLDAGWGLEGHSAPDTPRRTFERWRDDRDRGHALCGPVALRGAEPGMTLGIHIEAIRPGGYGWTVADGSPRAFNKRLGLEGGAGHMLIWTLDADALVGRDQYGRSVPLRPFMGVMGLPPDAPGQHSTAPPRFCGGNIDCKELVAGSTLYLPIAVPGALFSVGDGHGAQADGEVSGTAIECPMEHLALTFSLLRDVRLTTPRAETAAGHLTFGFHETLDEAMFIALDAMLGLLGERYGLARADALALASIVVDLRVTQIVNGVCGVHAVLPHDAVAGLVPNA